VVVSGGAVVVVSGGAVVVVSGGAVVVVSGGAVVVVSGGAVVVVVGVVSPPELPQAPATVTSSNTAPDRHFLVRTIVPPILSMSSHRPAREVTPKGPFVPQLQRNVGSVRLVRSPGLSPTVSRTGPDRGIHVRLTFDDATEAFRSEFVAWLDANLPDAATTSERPTSSAGVPSWSRAFQRQMFDDGWLVPGYPPEHGGRNAGLFEQMVYFEELADRHVSRSLNPQGLGIVASSIIEFGNDEQRRDYAVPILRAEITAALGMSEPGAGSDLAGLTTRAMSDGDHFVVNGQKVWTSGAHDADVLLTFVRTDPDVPKHRGISALIIDTDTPGLERRPFPDLMGPDHLDFNEVFFDDVVVPHRNLVGDLNDGWRICTGALAHERAMLWVLWSEGLDTSLADLIRRVGDTPLVQDDVFLDRLGSLLMDAESLRLLGHRGLARQQRGLVAAEQSLLKLMGSEGQRNVALLALDALGADAIDQREGTSAFQPWGANRGDASWFDRYLNSFAGTISGGTSEIQRNIIAERVLGLPRG
jgi:alkylation response protein AidB-like acyl-CoA dehydrogenase